MKCKGKATHTDGKQAVAHAKVSLIGGAGQELESTRSGDNGAFSVSAALADARYKVRCELFGASHEQEFEVVNGQDCDVDIDCGPVFEIEIRGEVRGNLGPVQFATAGKRLAISAVPVNMPQLVDEGIEFRWTLRPEVRFVKPSKKEIELVVPDDFTRLEVELVAIEKQVAAGPAAYIKKERVVEVQPAEIQMIGGEVAIGREPIGIRLHRTQSECTEDQALWVAIRNRTRAISFGRYHEFMNRALRWEEGRFVAGVEVGAARERIQRDLNELGTHLHGVGAYQTLKLLTEAFLLVQCGVRIEADGERHKLAFEFGERGRGLCEPFTPKAMAEKLRLYLGDRAQLPYITRVVEASFPDLEDEGWQGRLIMARINEPCLIELIWSYWMEEGMLVQTMNAVSRRFQNVRANGDRDPLANLEITPLRPLNNLLWGHIQDEYNRLTVRRRAYEYIHHYGMTLFGKAASDINAADYRSKFLEAFHNLLFQASVFFKEDFQTTVIADGFPLLNSLKEVHLILAQGAHNQFGDLPWTARVEMLLMQYMLARGEIREFLGSRVMVPYKEPWEAQVDAMKTLQGWTDVTVSHFRDLAVYGEQLLLAIRYGDWINVNDEDSAKNWARYFRPEIQAYLHAYRAVTGVDLTNADTVDATIPGVYLQKRVAVQRTR